MAPQISNPTAIDREALRRTAAEWRRRFTLPVVAVAGAAGKTTTKELVAAILGGRWPQVLATADNWNGYLGVPRTILRLTSEHQVAVVEIGIDEPGAMHDHLEAVVPTVAVVTAVGAEHLEKLGDADLAAREELLLLEQVAASGGQVAVQLDDPIIAAAAARLPEQAQLGFTLDGPLPPGPRRLRGRWREPELIVDGAGLDGLVLTVPLPGAHNARNLLAAVAVARLLGLDGDEISRGLDAFAAPPGRAETFRLEDGTVVFGDHFNANPVSMAAALHLLAGGGGERWACLGDMLELGPAEERYHRDLAEPILATGIEQVLLVGERMRALEEELAGRGGRVRWFPTTDDLADHLGAHLRPGARVLVKGSRGMRLERVLDRLFGWSEPDA